jgi:hypothetical protein
MVDVAEERSLVKGKLVTGAGVEMLSSRKVWVRELSVCLRSALSGLFMESESEVQQAAR